MDFMKVKDYKGIIIVIDFEKVFDFVNWNFLLKLLELFGFGEFFRVWIKMFYSNILSFVINNGFLIFFFNFKRGVC